MSNSLKIYDFILIHKERKKNTNLHTLASDHPDLNKYFNGAASGTIKMKMVFDSFLRKLNNDLNSEVLKNTKTRKIIKRSRFFQNGSYTIRDVESDYGQKILYGILHAGRITNNAILEKVSVPDSEYEYNVLDKDRIYDDFFFLLHLSFRCNKARLFILSRAEHTKVDAVFKKYLIDNMFKANSFAKTKSSDYISTDYKDAVLGRSMVTNILISKNETIVSEDDGLEYEVEIRLKPKSNNRLRKFTNDIVSKLQRSKVQIENDSSEDIASPIKFSIKDPETNSTKTIAFGDEDNFVPRLLLEDEEVLGDDGVIDVEKMKSLCLNYIVYNNDNLI